ncbi:MAG: class I SAM-dependent methyltransferase, partial [Cytophagales bacterium]|nr:class I SAM-dependent methyltransferase [Cytophagales bacterium]
MSTPCPICSSIESKRSYLVKEMYYGRREEFEYLECTHCGLLYLHNPPERISDYYPENYHCHRIGLFQKLTPKSLLANYRNRKFVIHQPDRLSQYLEKKSPTPSLLRLFSKTQPSLESKILDVGCGSGDFLFQLEQVGFKDLSGMDPFLPEDIFKIKSKVNFYKKSLADTRGRYDIITLNHVFEHMDNPEGVLKQLKSLLKAKGRIMIRIPVTGGYAWEEFRENWYQIDAPRHLYLYS